MSSYCVIPSGAACFPLTPKHTHARHLIYIHMPDVKCSAWHRCDLVSVSQVNEHMNEEFTPESTSGLGCGHKWLTYQVRSRTGSFLSCRDQRTAVSGIFGSGCHCEERWRATSGPCSSGFSLIGQFALKRHWFLSVGGGPRRVSGFSSTWGLVLPSLHIATCAPTKLIHMRPYLFTWPTAFITNLPCFTHGTQRQLWGWGKGLECNSEAQ